VPDFDTLTRTERRSEVERLRRAELLRLQRSPSLGRQYRQTRKNYRHTEAYIHLRESERRQFIEDIADSVSNWGFSRLFGECVDKVHFDPLRTGRTVDEQAFEQVVSRFEQFLQAETSDPARREYGLLIHDNNETVARKHTLMMKRFRQHGTFWTQVSNIIETPLFVDSQLTGMIQIADLCSYALRRFLENGERSLFEKVFTRAHRRGTATVGVRHFSDNSCSCDICDGHG
jgi:hypothetical protein